MAGDNDFDGPSPAGLITQELWNLLEPCAVNGMASLPGETKQRSSTSILAAVSKDPAKYNIPKIAASAVGGAIAGVIVADVLGAIIFWPVTALAGILLPIFSADERVVQVMVLNGMDQDLVRESASSMTHGMQTLHPVLQVQDPKTGALIQSSENIIPAARTTTVIHPGQAPQQARVFGMGIYQFEKSQIKIFGIQIPAAFYGVEGGLSFKLADGSRTGISASFMVPEKGANAYAVTLDNAPHYGDLATFVAKTVSNNVSLGNDRDATMQIWCSMTPRDYPDSASTTDVVMTVAIMPM